MLGEGSASRTMGDRDINGRRDLHSLDVAANRWDDYFQEEQVSRPRMYVSYSLGIFKNRISVHGD